MTSSVCGVVDLEVFYTQKHKHLGTGYLEELSGALAVSSHGVFERFPQRGAFQLHQIEGSSEGQHGDQVLHGDRTCRCQVN